eukprot:Lithocolla_globosa_v1_NODE_5415_length_1243_cov_3.764310.p1 type:complete len:346 gc:universal NODE_5415_length_1243_cov_3.764310:1243-206(-)
MQEDDSTETNLPNLIGSSSSHQVEREEEQEEEQDQESEEQLQQRLESFLNLRDDDWSEAAQSEALLFWRTLQNTTHELSFELCEQLRLILEPTLATKLKGDYRTGKRLNMRKIIPYIASQFKKDKIWLRRTKPSKRQYQVLLAVDDSKSMSDSKSVQMAYETVAMVADALTKLEVGQLGVLRFGENPSVLHGFDEPFTDAAGAKILHNLSFKQDKTFFGDMIQSAELLLQQAQAQDVRGGQLYQLVIVISDGAILDENRSKLKQKIQDAGNDRLLMVFIAIDNREKSLLELQDVTYVQNKLKISSYLDTFPFDYYILLRDINRLPSILSDALRQWFEILRSISDA